MSTLSIKTALTLDATVSRSPDQISCMLGGEVVLMSIEQGTYFKIDAIGSRIWDLLATPQSIRALCDQLMTEFDVTRSTCEADVVDFLHDLLADDLIQVR